MTYTQYPYEPSSTSERPPGSRGAEGKRKFTRTPLKAPLNRRRVAARGAAAGQGQSLGFRDSYPSLSRSRHVLRNRAFSEHLVASSSTWADTADVASRTFASEQAAWRNGTEVGGRRHPSRALREGTPPLPPSLSPRRHSHR